MNAALRLAAIALLSACSVEPGATSTPPPPVTVVLEHSAFVPPGGATLDGIPALTVPVDTTVTWTNEDAIDHTATEYQAGFPKPEALFDLALEPGASASFTFTVTGEYEVGCVPHPAMQMIVVVE